MVPVFSLLKRYVFSRRVLPIIALLALITVALTPSVSTGLMLPHLRLKASFPASDTTLVQAPEAVKLWFSEPADVATSRIGVKDSHGATVPLEKPQRGAGKDDPLTARFVKAPSNGRYTVEWRAMSKDGHVVSDSFSFSVQSPK